MLVFIDESGDPGFKVERGSSPIFAAAMVIFNNGADAATTETVIRRTMARVEQWPEFKFNKCSASIKDVFFQAVRKCPFQVRAIVVRKDIIYSPHLMTNKEDFYRFFVRKMMENDNETLENAKVVIDGSGDREFRRVLQISLRRQVGSKVESIRFNNSRNDLLVQLADMCVGAIARSYRRDRKDRARWRKMLAPRIDDVWDFR